MDKVLIVENDPDVQSMLKQELGKYEGQFEVLTATDSLEAVAVLQKVPVAVLLTNLVVPNMDRVELLAYINEKHPRMPCVLMTKHPNDIIKRPTETNDTIIFIEKPKQFSALASIIIDVLDRLDEGDFLAGASVSDVLQLVHMEQKTCQLEICGKNRKSGKFYQIRGQIIDAHCGEFKGVDAVHEMVNWSQIRFRIKPLPKEGVKKRFHKSLKSLITEGIT